MDPIKVWLKQEPGGHWLAGFWGKGGAILRPVPGNVRPASAAEWTTAEDAVRELPELVGSPVEVVKVCAREGVWELFERNPPELGGRR